ncbi:hypothetical protein MW290_10745 [Aquincola tertiaricarbonis]|uniref:Uncharacterized protein n=1 Tax=Aquincola tertiaricarbonis TaxID=391953 RepID=A0ABY4S5C5_AQUTE|nr:hypothetical protein [Aquincola tertiaricarbonis]URI06389.1 hypothetical protein MW290_10745 [Aquincola tertiaricarbonis]
MSPRLRKIALCTIVLAAVLWFGVRSCENREATAGNALPTAAAGNKSAPAQAASEVAKPAPTAAPSTATTSSQTGACVAWPIPSDTDSEDERQRKHAALQTESLAFLSHALAHPDPLVRAAAALLAEAPDRQALIASARHTRDPALYTLARQACLLEPDTPACRELSLTRQAELEPDNAAVWLAIADDAMLQGDEASAAAAIVRAERAPRMEQRVHLAAAVLAGVPWPPERAVGRMGVVEAAMRAGLAVGLPGHVGLVRHCSAAAMADANRKIACGHLADQLVRPGASLLDATVALSIARRGGWSTERTDALQTRLQAAQRKAADVKDPMEQRWSCAAAQALSKRVIDASAMGELTALEK